MKRPAFKKGEFPLNWSGGVIALLVLSLIPAIVLSILHNNWGTAAFAGATMVLMLVPIAIQWKTSVYIPSGLGLFVALFAYGTEYLGQGKYFYQKYWWWDVMLHSGSGLVFGILGLIILLIALKNDRVKASPFVLCMFAFCFALAIGLMWEVFEYTGDQIFHTTMQHADTTGVNDTMKDEIVDLVGAAVGSALGYFYLCPGGTKTLWGKLIQKTVRRNNKHTK